MWCFLYNICLFPWLWSRPSRSFTVIRSWLVNKKINLEIQKKNDLEMELYKQQFWSRQLRNGRRHFPVKRVFSVAPPEYGVRVTVTYTILFGLCFHSWNTFRGSRKFIHQYCNLNTYRPYLCFYFVNRSEQTSALGGCCYNSPNVGALI